MEYYMITLYNKKNNTDLIGLLKANSVYDAEKKGREWGKTLGDYEFYNCLWITDKMKSLEIGNVIVCIR